MTTWWVEVHPQTLSGKFRPLESGAIIFCPCVIITPWCIHQSLHLWRDVSVDLFSLRAMLPTSIFCPTESDLSQSRKGLKSRLVSHRGSGRGLLHYLGTRYPTDNLIMKPFIAAIMTTVWDCSSEWESHVHLPSVWNESFLMKTIYFCQTLPDYYVPYSNCSLVTDKRKQRKQVSIGDDGRADCHESPPQCMAFTGMLRIVENQYDF